VKEAMSRALPQLQTAQGAAYHSKYARNDPL
jgi:hypothetical protein